MKNQYFADKRDYFKWNLVKELSQLQGKQRSFMYLPMLTPDDSTREGCLTDYPVGEGDKRIHDYLCDCLRRDYRNIKALRLMFPEIDIKYETYWDDQYFNTIGRGQYFEKIPINAWRDDLVFIDPDVGIEPKTYQSMNKNGIEKYLLWDDLESMYCKLGADTILLIYQHLQANAHKVKSDLDYRCKRLETIWPEKKVDYIRDKDVAFLVIHNNRAVTDCLNSMAKLYGHFIRVDDIDDLPVKKLTGTFQPSKIKRNKIKDNVILNAEELTVDEVVNQQVLCPACKEKRFARWPLGWDAHAVKCSGIEGNNPENRKKTFKSKYRNLFRK